MSRTTQNKSERPSQHIPAVYDQVVIANQSSTGVSESETDILSPGFQFSQFQPENGSKLIVDHDQGKIHRIDNSHDTADKNHLSLRLQKFVELTQTYARPEEQAAQNHQSVKTSDESKDISARPATSSPVAQSKTVPVALKTTENPTTEVNSNTDSRKIKDVTLRATTNWAVNSPRKFVGHRLEEPSQSIAPPVKPKKESSIGPDSVRTRFDSDHSLTSPHFSVDQGSPAAQPAIPKPHLKKSESAEDTQTSSSAFWHVEALKWPVLTNQLLKDSSLVIQKIGKNISGLMTGDQNQLIVTSTQRREGVTTLAISIARWARSINQQVLLIDADLDNAGLTSSIRVNHDVSWLSIVDSPSQVGKSIVQDENSGLFLMPLAPMVDRSNLPSNIYQSLSKMLDPISDCFDLIVMDVGTSDQFLVESVRADLVADMALLVQDVSQTEENDFVHAKSNLLSAGIAKMIVAENSTGMS